MCGKWKDDVKRKGVLYLSIRGKPRRNHRQGAKKGKNIEPK
jgi:hypothetical protein